MIIITVYSHYLGLALALVSGLHSCIFAFSHVICGSLNYDLQSSVTNNVAQKGAIFCCQSYILVRLVQFKQINK